MKDKLRVVIAKLGLDSHWRGAIIVARALRDAGMEVIFLGNQTPEVIVTTALQEDADMIGLSSLSGNHLILSSKVMELVRSHGLNETLVVLGGTIPKKDFTDLNNIGIQGIFPSGSSLNEIISFIRTNVKK